MSAFPAASSPAPGARPASRAIQAQCVLAVLLFVAAAFVRGLEAEPPPMPLQAPDGPGVIEAPLQLLTQAGRGRLAELDERVSPARRVEWRETRLLLGQLDDCPGIVKWLARPEGQEAERLVSTLSRGSREDALAALGLIFRVAAVTDWTGDGAESAGRLGQLLQDWLTLWGERGATDGLLYEPTLGAVIVYGAVMHVAYKDGWFGDDSRSLERARGFLGPLMANHSGLKTELGAAFEGRYPGLLPRDLGPKSFLDGLVAEAKLLFPDIRGCD